MESILYYIGLYLVVVLIGFFKLKRVHKEKLRDNWREIFNTSLEIVYTSSGIVIALLLNVKGTWIPIVVISFLFIVLFSVFLETSNDYFDKRVHSFLHLSLIIIIIIATILTYTRIIPKVDIVGNTKPDIDNHIKEYLVIIPYYDNSLANHIGYSKLGTKYFLYEVKVKSGSYDSVISLAQTKFRKDTLLKPIYTQKGQMGDINNNIEIVTDKIRVVEIKNVKYVSCPE